jgi:acetyl-CoA carboxylase biotin carboxyl carrier protein
MVGMHAHAAPQLLAPPAAIPAEAAQRSAASADAAATSGLDAGTPSNLKTIYSPMVGTYYSAAAPDAPPFVRVGDTVGDETVLCIIEAMKLMNEIKAETKGRIHKILVENGVPVEYNQPLFLIEP